MNEKIDLEPLAFEEAIKFFRNKVPMEPKDFADLQRRMRHRAFTVANVATLDIIEAIYQEVIAALEQGGTLQEFRKKINKYIEDQGYIGLSPYRTDNIFRTNIQTAYNVGRYEQQTDPAVIEARPIWIYDAVNDDRTRPSHSAMDGIARRHDDPFWDTWYPPNGYRCRCSVRTMSEAEAKRRGLIVETGKVPVERRTANGQRVMVSPDIGFDTNPAKEAWQPDLKNYQPALREQYQKKAKF